MKKILLIGGLLAIVGIGIGYSIYNKPHENIRSIEPDVATTSTILFTQFETDENAANSEYLGKTIKVTGKVQGVKTESGKTSVTLEGGGMIFGVICNLDEQSEHPRIEFEEGEEVTFKGKCSGYLSDVVLDRCVEIK